MIKNEGKADRIIRVIIGILALYAGWQYNQWWFLLAAIALITAATGFCGLYKLLGISTIETKVVKAKPKKKKL